MGRYKSVLMAQRDAREYPYHVDMPVPPMGLGKQMDAIESWLRGALGDNWRKHGAGVGSAHVARYMFRSRTEADLFEAAWTAGTFSIDPHC